jgi:hypothetical protein
MIIVSRLTGLKAPAKPAWLVIQNDVKVYNFKNSRSIVLSSMTVFVTYRG